MKKWLAEDIYMHNIYYMYVYMYIHMIIYVNLGKLLYFTKLNSSAIKGDAFPS